MKVCAVIVTYGDRFKFLKQVIEACLKEGVDKIIVVDNASDENSRNALREYEAKLKDKLIVMYLEGNTGSAGGYRRGLERAYKCEDCDFIWLLDDDNKPCLEALLKLKEMWKQLSIAENEKKRNVALLSFREDKKICNLIKSGRNYQDWIKRTDYFLGFHILDILNWFLIKMKRILVVENFSNHYKRKFLMPYAPYGGLFFHKELLETIGYPNEIFFTYADDHEFTFRIILNRGKIFLVPQSVVIDIDKSWIKNKKGLNNLIPVLLSSDKENKKRVYLTVRNKIIFERLYFRQNNFVFLLNKTLYLSYLFVMSLIFFKIKNFLIVLKGVSDGEKVQL